MQKKRVKVEYIHTSKMLPDGLTKVFEGKELTSFCNNLLEIETVKITGGRWVFCAPLPVGLSCLIPFHIAVGGKTQ